MNELISLYIDNELKLDEKIQFALQIRDNKEFAQDTIDFLSQEQLLRSDVVRRGPSVTVTPKAPWHAIFQAPVFHRLEWALAVTVIIIATWLIARHPASPEFMSKRFIIYQPKVTHMDITGSFTDWHRIPMQKVGDTGYWEITLEIPAGEHRYTYIIDNNIRIADPTVLTWEMDDFGGKNSILHTGDRA